MKIGTKITLNETEQRLCKHIAKERYKVNRKKGVKNSKIGNQSDYLTDLEGFGGEMAFCKLFNVYPDLKVQVTNQQTDTGDCVLPNGKVIDVKTTKYKNGKLLAAKWKTCEDIDAYALMVGTFPSYKFMGFMSRQELLQDSRLTNLGHGEGYAAHQSELAPVM